MSRYFSQADPADAAWAVWFLAGTAEATDSGAKARGMGDGRIGVASWLFEESYHAVGDLAETIALLLPDSVSSSDEPLHDWVERSFSPIGDARRKNSSAIVLDAWRSLGGIERFVWNKLITGSFRVGVSQSLLVRALVRRSSEFQRRQSRTASPATGGRRLKRSKALSLRALKPLPNRVRIRSFSRIRSRASSKSSALSSEWQAEWKWDGIRAQLIRRQGSSYIWSRGDELITERFPELIEASRMAS